MGLNKNAHDLRMWGWTGYIIPCGDM